MPRLLAAIGPAQIGHRRFTIECHVVDPVLHLLHGAAADIASDIRLAAEQLTQQQKFVRAEVVVLDHPAPVRVDHALALFTRADPIAPVVFIGKAATRPT